jgi:hypothetical protein
MLQQHQRMCVGKQIHEHVVMERKGEIGVLCLKCDTFRPLSSLKVGMRSRRVRLSYVFGKSVPLFMDQALATVLEYHASALLVKVDGYADPLLVRAVQLTDVSE